MAKFKDEDEGGSRPSRKHSSKGLPFIYEPRCAVCTSTYRRSVDQMLVAGFSLANIAAHFERLGETFSRASVGRHSKNHLTLHSAAIRRIVEKRTDNMLENVEEAAGFLASKRAILEVALQKSYDNVLSGSAHLTAQDMLSIMEKLERMEAEEHAVAVDEMIRDFKAFSQAVKQLVAEDIWPQIVEQYRANLEATKIPALEQMIQIGPSEIEDIEPQDIEIEDEE